jgi:ATP-binding cassette subfamily B (MDR/TAP) protein 1
LRAILNQECAWFDQINYTELSARISRETLAIQRGLGEKAGNVTLAMGTIIAGIVVGALRGWAISLCILAIMPMIAISSLAYFKSLASGSAKGLMAYSQSAGYAEQAMSAIRVVVAFG